MNYYLIEPEIMKNLYQMEQTTSENIIATQKLMQETKEKIIGENIRNRENMENLVTQKMESQFHNMKQELEKTEEKQKKDTIQANIKVGVLAFLTGLVLSAVFFLLRK